MPLWNEMNLPSPNGDFCVYDAHNMEIMEGIFLPSGPANELNLEMFTTTNVEVDSELTGKHLGNLGKKDLVAFDDMSKLVSVLSDAATQMGADHPVRDETKIFLALQNRMSLKLPCDKFLQILKSVGRCLRHLVLIKLFEQYLNLAQSFIHGMNEASKTAMLPSRQQLEYLLIRTQGATKLILKTISYIEKTFIYLMQQLKIGHIVPTLTMACATLGRIRTTHLALLKQLCGIYQELRPWLDRLQTGTWCWPENPDLPADLWAWLNPDFFKEKTQESECDKKLLPFLNTFFSPCDNIDDIMTLRNNEEQSQNDRSDVVVIDDDSDCLVLDDDIGEVQSRNIENGASSSMQQPVDDENNNDSNLEMSDNEDDVEVIEIDNEQVNENKEQAKSIGQSSLLLQRVSQIKNIKEMSLLLQLLVVKERATIAAIFDGRIKKRTQAKIKRLLDQSNAEVSSSKLLNCQDRSTYLKLLLKKTKKDLLTVLDSDKQNQKTKRAANDRGNLNLAPVRSLKNLRKLFFRIERSSNMNLKQCKKFKTLLEDGERDARLLKEHGEQALCNKLVFKTSKKLINFYKQKCRTL